MEEMGQEGAGRTWRPEMLVSWRKIHLPKEYGAASVAPKPCETCVVWGISFPKWSSRWLLFCGHYIKRQILIHLISRKLAFWHRDISAFSDQFVLQFVECVWSSREVNKKKAENFSSYYQLFRSLVSVLQDPCVLQATRLAKTRRVGWERPSWDLLKLIETESQLLGAAACFENTVFLLRMI